MIFRCRPCLAARLSCRVGGVPRAPGWLLVSRMFGLVSLGRACSRVTAAAIWRAQGQRSASRRRSRRPPRARRTAAENRRSRRRLGSQCRAVPVRASICVRARSSQASAQACSRAAARADRIAFSARGRSPASTLTSRETTRSRQPVPRVPAVPQHRDVGQAVPAQGERGSQVRDNLARIVDRPRHPPPGKALRQAAGQARYPHRFPQHDGTCLGDQATPVRRHREPGVACVILHSVSAFALEWTGL